MFDIMKLLQTSPDALSGLAQKAAMQGPPLDLSGVSSMAPMVKLDPGMNPFGEQAGAAPQAPGVSMAPGVNLMNGQMPSGPGVRLPSSFANMLMPGESGGLPGQKAPVLSPEALAMLNPNKGVGTQMGSPSAGLGRAPASLELDPTLLSQVGKTQLPPTLAALLGV